MEELSVPTGPLRPNLVEEAQKTFFFEREDGSVIAVQEREAWNMLKVGNKVLGPQRPQPKLIGVSDGVRFQMAVREAQALLKEGRTEEAQDMLRKGASDELEAARGHIEMPRNFDMVDRNGRPVNLSQLR